MTEQRQQLDYIRGLRESVGALERDLGEAGVREGVARIAETLGLAEDVALAALYRESKRNGYTLKLMIDELERQIEAVRKEQATD